MLSIKGKDVFRIVTLGGSSTWGAGVNDGETYPAQLQEVLNKHFGRGRVEVINAGLPWFSTEDIVVLFEALIVKLKPDLVTFYIGHNDAHRLVSQMLARRELGSILGKVEIGVDALAPYSYLFKKAQYRLTNLSFSRNQDLSRPFTADEMAQQGDSVDSSFRARVMRVKGLVDSQGIYTLFITQIQSPIFEYQERGMHGKAAELQLMNYQVYGEYLQSQIRTTGLDMLAVYYLTHQDFGRILRDVAGERIVDFATWSGGRFDLLLNYIHLNQEGNKLLAELLAERVIRICAEGGISSCP